MRSQSGLQGDLTRARSLLSPKRMDTLRRHRWRVRDTICSPWQELPGLYTAFEIWSMRRRGCFSAAVPIEDTEVALAPRSEELRAFYLFSES